jgi:hypothetical protein
MVNQDWDETKLWYRASARNLLVFALMWLWPTIPIVLFSRRLTHDNTGYLFVVLWVLVGATMVLRPKWISSWMRWSTKIMEQMGESLEKRLPPGFP